MTQEQKKMKWNYAKCKQCGEEVKASANVCPHCSVKNPGIKTKDAIMGGGILALIVLFIAWPSSKQSKADANAENEPVPAAKVQLKPEQVIRFDRRKYACLTTALLEKSITHAIKDEATKFEAMFSGLNCVELPENMDFKIVSTDIGIRTGIEIVDPKKPGMSNGLFTTNDGAIVVD